MGDFAAALRFDDVPGAVIDRAKLLILDSIGVACASTTFSFADRAASALQSLGGGDRPVIGMPIRLGVRDGAMLNGLLIHGLD